MSVSRAQNKMKLFKLLFKTLSPLSSVRLSLRRRSLTSLSQTVEKTTRLWFVLESEFRIYRYLSHGGHYHKQQQQQQ